MDHTSRNDDPRRCRHVPRIFLLLSPRYGTERVIMHIHHWFSLVYLTWGLYSKVSGAEIVGVIFGSEITNPMLQLRWMLRKSGNYESTVGKINDILFAITFISTRCGVGAYFLYCVLTHPRPSTTVKLGGVVFYAISCVFGFQVVAFARRKITTWRQNGVVSSPSPATAQSTEEETKSCVKTKKKE